MYFFSIENLKKNLKNFFLKNLKIFHRAEAIVPG
jgi:hypothetical protein